MKKVVKAVPARQQQIYINILNRFKATDDIPGWMNEPFNAFGISFATNRCVLVCTPQCGEFEQHEDKIAPLYPLRHTGESITISTKELKEKLDAFPVVDKYDEIEVDCDACDGDGFVDFEFEHGLSSYELEGECPVCNGLGRKTTRSPEPTGKEKDSNKCFRIKMYDFHPERMAELLFVAEALNAENITMFFVEKYMNGIAFQINEVEMLLMPLTGYPHNEVGQIIE